MFELFGVYALLLAAWGLWHARRGAVSEEPAPEGAAPAVAGRRERGAAARRHLSTLP